MRQVLRAGALGRPRGMGWRGRREEGSGWGTHVNPWLIHVNVWQKPLQHCKVISLQWIKINGKKINKNKIKYNPRKLENLFIQGSLQASQVALVVKNLHASARDIKRRGFHPWVRKIPWRRAQQPTPVFLPGETYGQRSMASYSPQDHKESDMTEVI